MTEQNTVDLSQFTPEQLADLRAQLKATPKEASYIQLNGHATVPKQQRQDFEGKTGTVKVELKVKFRKNGKGNQSAILCGKVPFKNITWDDSNE